MRPSHGLLTAAAILGLSTWSVMSAGAQTAAHITTGETGRFQIHTVPRGAPGHIDSHYIFLLDTKTAAVYTTIGQGNQWTQYAAALDIKAHPVGEGWQAPRFQLSIVRSPEASAPILLLVNTSTGATYTRSTSGMWERFTRGAEG